MPYVAPTAAQFKATFPSFAAVADDVVDAALVEAAGKVDETWTETDFATARMLYAAHVMTLRGIGTGAEAEAYKAGAGGFQSMRSGALTLTRFNRYANATSGPGADLERTTYGVTFLGLLAMNFGGPVTIANLDGGLPSPRARDWRWW